jgi:hypothetical protein
MGCPTEISIDKNLTFTVCTHAADRREANADEAPTFRVYAAADNDIPLLTGTLDRIDAANTVGFYGATIACTTANGFVVDENYTVKVRAVVDTDPAGISYTFLVTNTAELLAEIKAKTDLLDTSAVTVVSGIDGDELTFYVGATFNETITGLTIPSDWVKVLFTLKLEDAAYADNAALLQVQLSNPGVAADGLIRCNGAAPGTGEAAWAGLTINQATGTVQVRVHMPATAALLPRVCRWDLKVITSDSPAEGMPLVVSSPAEIRYTTTRSTS